MDLHAQNATGAQEIYQEEIAKLKQDYEQKITDLRNENFVVLDEIEAVKTRARQMLEDKDDEIDKIKTQAAPIGVVTVAGKTSDQDN